MNARGALLVAVASVGAVAQTAPAAEMPWVTVAKDGKGFVMEPGGKPFVLGYCMGGTLLGAALGQAAEEIGGAVFLASPWDFHAGDRGLADRIAIGSPSAIQRASQPASWTT